MPARKKLHCVDFDGCLMNEKVLQAIAHFKIAQQRDPTPTEILPFLLAHNEALTQDLAPVPEHPEDTTYMLFTNRVSQKEKTLCCC